MNPPKPLSGTIQRVHHELWNDDADPQTVQSPHGESAPGLDMDRRIRSLIAEAEPLATVASIEHVVDQVKARIDGLGPLHQYALDETVTEIMVNGDGSVWVERQGEVECTGQYLEPEATLQLVRRLASTAGRRIDRTEPSVDVRLKDGSRLHAIIPPLAVDGPCVTIRRFAVRPIGLAKLAAPPAEQLLMKAVADEQTIIIGGGTSSGKTTLLNALAAFINADSRVVTIEDAAELRLPGTHVVRLETRNAAEGVRHVGLRELVRHALRMRPDRIICGEMRGAEALDLVQALNTGHRGSLSTVHANSASGVLRRIETMMLLGDADLPLQAIREQLADCIDLVVMTSRGDAGARRVIEIARVPERPTADWSLEPVFEGHDTDKHTAGTDKHTAGAVNSGDDL